MGESGEKLRRGVRAGALDTIPEIETIGIGLDCEKCHYQGACEVELLRKCLDTGLEEAVQLGLTKEEAFSIILLWAAEEMGRLRV